jgi:hypothetical protein
MKMASRPFGFSRFEVHAEWHIITLDPSYASPAKVPQFAGTVAIYSNPRVLQVRSINVVIIVG